MYDSAQALGHELARAHQATLLREADARRVSRLVRPSRRATRSPRGWRLARPVWFAGRPAV